MGPARATPLVPPVPFAQGLRTGLVPLPDLVEFAGPQRVEPGDVIFELDMDPYLRSFRHVSTHLMLNEVTEAEARGALAAGRAYVAFDWLADPTGFVFCARHGETGLPVGSEMPWSPNVRLQAEAPLAGRFKLVRNGEIVADQTGHEFDFEPDVPGVYRIEVWLNIAGEDRPWILTNPIYVRPRQ